MEKEKNDKQALERCAQKILTSIGVPNTEDCLDNWPVTNSVRTKPFVINGVQVCVEICTFFYKEPVTCRIDIDMYLPHGSVMAQTFMDHCAKIEHTPTNHHHEYCSGPTYPDYQTELKAEKHVFAYSPWQNTAFYVRSEGYTLDELDEAADNAIALALQFTKHFPDLATLRYWKVTDTEVIAKAKEIVANADFEETDIDREEKTHWLCDRNSFFKGWFYPFHDHGNGTFDTGYKPYYAAIGVEGSFEYAVSCILLFDKEYIAKARKACRIRTETTTVKY